MALLKQGLNERQSISTDSLGGPGPIAFNQSQLENTLDQKRKEIKDYIRLRLADGIVDVELDSEHYDLAIRQALVKYRQKATNSTEESYAFLELLPETQEYILPQEIVHVRQIFRRGIGSVTGTTASQFEPFASGYLNTYMLVAGRVGGLANYELFTHYQEQAMKMFGGHINFTWNPATRKLTLVRKIPDTGRNLIRANSITADGTEVGSTITIITSQPQTAIEAGGSLRIQNCPIAGYNGNYQIDSVDVTTNTIVITAANTLGAASVETINISKTQITSSFTDTPAESVLLHIYNKKPDVMILNDPYIFPWIQDFAYSFAKGILGEARSKFASLAGPQGGTTLNGTALIAESREEMTKLEEDLKNMVDGSMPLTWVIG
jgi:hypothetical protein